MRIRLIQGYNGFPVGHEMDLGSGVAELLIQRKKAVAVDAVNDPDHDGQDEGGEAGTKKAFSRPPVQKRKK